MGLNDGKTYANCLGCGTAIPLGEAHCDGCKERHGQKPDYLVNVTATKRPPYEKNVGITNDENQQP